MEQILTVAQIEARFPAEWILIADPQTSETLDVQAGRVLWHSKDRDEVYRKAVEHRSTRFAILYTGSMPADTAVVL